MPELRKDPIVGRWVIIATERARRPGTFLNPTDHGVEDENCPFCVSGHTSETKEVYALREEGLNVNGADWKVCVLESGTPTLKEGEASNRETSGLYTRAHGHGAHEVVVETPEHIGNMADLSCEQIRLVIDTYRQRINEFEKDSDFKYVIPYKNYGWASGCRRINHSRSQIIAMPVHPLRVKEKLVGAKNYFDEHQSCLFCDLIAQEKKDGTRIVSQNDHFIAMAPFEARFPFELWILPKDHHCEFAKGVVGHEDDLAKMLKDILSRLKIGLDDPAYNYVIHSAPFQKNPSETKWRTIEQDYHWHIEVMPRLTRVAGFEKGTGFYICPIPPEEAAEYLRGVPLD